MEIKAIDLRVGYIISMNGKYCVVLELIPIERGRGKSYVNVVYKDFNTGNKNNSRLATDDNVLKMTTDEKEAIFLYKENDNIEIMLSETGEQFSIKETLIGKENINFLCEGMILSLICIEETAEIIGVKLPHHYNFKVETKDKDCAIIGNGVQIKVPEFIKAGDEIVVNIEEQKYLSKA